MTLKKTNKNTNNVKNIKSTNVKKLDISSEFKRIEKEIDDNILTKEQLFKWFKEEIKRKDDIIDKLRKDNKLLFNTAMRTNDKDLDRLNNSEDK